MTGHADFNSYSNRGRPHSSSDEMVTTGYWATIRSIVSAVQPASSAPEATVLLRSHKRRSDSADRISRSISKWPAVQRVICVAG
jgi:hypothetical protein